MYRPGLLVAAILIISGCDSQNDAGEVLATVNGETVTRTDTVADLVARGVPIDGVTAKMSQAMLSVVVDRRLLAEHASRTGVDREPGYAAIAARAQEMALVQQLLAKWRAAVSNPSRDDVQRFVDRNPQMFADRAIYLLQDVQTNAKGLDAKALESCGSLEAVQDYLRQRDHPFWRTSASLDTMTIDLPAFKRISGVVHGEPFATASGVTLIVRSVVRASPAPVTGEPAMQIAAQILRKQLFEVSVQKHMQALRTDATITYASVPPGIR